MLAALCGMTLDSGRAPCRVVGSGAIDAWNGGVALVVREVDVEPALLAAVAAAPDAQPRALERCQCPARFSELRRGLQ